MAEADLKKGLTNPLPVDLTDDCTRLLGQLCYTGSPIDPRSIRALSALIDSVDVSDRCTRSIGQLCFGGIPIDPRAIRALAFLTDKVDVSGSSVNTTDYPINAALRAIPGIETFYKLGASMTIPSSTFILLSNLTSATRVSNFPPISQQMQIVSTNVNDTAAGTGAQQVTIDYLTEPSSIFGFRRFSEEVLLNGVAPVNTIATNINRIERFRVSRVGSGAVAAGDINLQSVGGATIFELIPTGENINRTAVHFVPNMYMSIVTDILFGTTTAGGVRFSFTDTPLNIAGNAVRNGLEEVTLTSSGIGKAINTPFYMKNDQNKRLSFAITVRGLAATQQGSGSLIAIDIPL